MKNVLVFLIGAAVGSAVTYKLVEKKFQKIADEEIASVKEKFSSKEEKQEDEEEPVEDKKEDKDVSDYKDIIEDNGYEEGGKPMTSRKPRVISPDEYGREYEYETLEYDYYEEDHVLVDEYDNPVKLDDQDRLVGVANLDRFGEYEKDMLWVRNDTMKCDLEIILIHGEYNM